jgi:putative inorganic carbon (hco3(-)) transporter
VIAYRPLSYGEERIPAIDLWMAVLVAGIVFQMIPLPAPVIDTISPADRRITEQLALRVPSSLPISLDLTRTGRALLVSLGAILIFLTARRVFATGGVRIAVRGISAIGMLLAAISLAQEATAGGLMYWRWKPLEEGPPPFGPFVNRNHFATWAVIAIPMCLGYLAAHSAAHSHHGRDQVPLPWRRRVATFFDGRAMGLTTSACLLLVALVMTMSRSGLLGIAAAAFVGLLLRGASRRSGGRAIWWIAGGTALVLVLTLAQVSPATLGMRLSTFRVSANGRFLIWRDTIPVVRDFWLTGTGAGTYLTSMLVYQRASPGWLFNQAHNHYLQVAAEGGLLLGIPAFMTLAVYTRDAWRRLAADRSGVYWIRAGALCGLAGVAAQSLWETGLTMPANAALAAIAAAIVVHDPPPPQVRH